MIDRVSFVHPQENSRHSCHLSAGKIMAGVFWNSGGVIHVDFLSHDV
jgi:hypothetical protein